MSARRTLVFAALIAALQIGFLGWMIAGRAAILRNGQAVLLKVEPVDPRDLLRGDYVRLGYEISRIPIAMVVDIPGGVQTLPKGAMIVRLSKGDDGYWHPRKAFVGTPTEPVQLGELDIKGQASEIWRVDGGTEFFVTYGIERYYVPEGEGVQIESDMSKRSFGVLLALAGDGTPQIKALYDGDRPIYEEPPY